MIKTKALHILQWRDALYYLNRRFWNATNMIIACLGLSNFTFIFSFLMFLLPITTVPGWSYIILIISRCFLNSMVI